MCLKAVFVLLLIPFVSVSQETLDFSSQHKPSNGVHNTPRNYFYKYHDKNNNAINSLSINSHTKNSIPKSYRKYAFDKFNDNDVLNKIVSNYGESGVDDVYTRSSVFMNHHNNKNNNDNNINNNIVINRNNKRMNFHQKIMKNNNININNNDRINNQINNNDNPNQNNNNNNINNNHNGKCVKEVSDRLATSMTSHTTTSTDGTWVSDHCETRPGQEHILRKYTFHPSTPFSSSVHFELTLFYYSDPFCHRPLYTIHAIGSYKLAFLSILVPNSSVTDYSLRYVTIRPETTEAAQMLQEKFKKSVCRADDWKLREVQVIYHNEEASEEDYYYDDVRNSTKNYDEYSDGIIDCLSSMHLSFHELQLFRIHQERYKNNHNKINNNNNNINSPNNNNNNNNIDNDGYINDDDDDDGGGGYEMRSLLLGDIHTEVSERESYRSLAFQDALLQVETPSCKVCEHIRASTATKPPELPIHLQPHLPRVLEGVWTSKKCEIRPYGVFVARTITYGPAKSWGNLEVIYDFFSDEQCSVRKHSITLNGRYSLDLQQSVANFLKPVSSSLTLPQGSFHVFIELREMQTTIFDETVRNAASKENLCKPHIRNRVFKFPHFNPITSDKIFSVGCHALDFKLPPLGQFIDTLKVEKRVSDMLLFLGHPPSSGEEWAMHPISSSPPPFKSQLLKELDQLNSQPYFNQSTIDFLSSILLRPPPTSFLPPLIKCQPPMPKFSPYSHFHMPKQNFENDFHQNKGYYIISSHLDEPQLLSDEKAASNSYKTSLVDHKTKRMNFDLDLPLNNHLHHHPSSSSAPLHPITLLLLCVYFLH